MATGAVTATVTATATAIQATHLTTSFDVGSYINSHVCARIQDSEHNNASFANAPGRS